MWILVVRVNVLSAHMAWWVDYFGDQSFLVILPFNVFHYTKINLLTTHPPSLPTLFILVKSHCIFMWFKILKKINDLADYQSCLRSYGCRWWRGIFRDIGVRDQLGQIRSGMVEPHPADQGRLCHYWAWRCVCHLKICFKPFLPIAVSTNVALGLLRGQLLPSNKPCSFIHHWSL